MRTYEYREEITGTEYRTRKKLGAYTKPNAKELIRKATDLLFMAFWNFEGSIQGGMKRCD